MTKLLAINVIKAYQKAYSDGTPLSAFYHKDTLLRAVMAELFTDFEYRNFSALTIPEILKRLNTDPGNTPVAVLPDPGPDIRQVLVAQKGLKMRAGKLAAQAAHASLAAITGPAGESVVINDAGQAELRVALDDDLQAWLSGAFKKICVYVNNEEELLALHAKALAAGMRCALIRDNGLTEFKGVPTYTMLAIGPHPKARIDPLTGSLPLY